MRRMRNPSPVRHELPEPTFDIDEQPEVEDERGVEREPEADGTIIFKCLSPIKVSREDSPSDPPPEPVETREGTNWLNNKWSRDSFGDGTNKYQYENQDGSFYEKHRDGSADFLSSRGYPKHYPTADRNAPDTR